MPQGLLLLIRHLFVILAGISIFFIQGPSFVYHLWDHLIEGGDSFINAWILSWNAHAFVTPGVSVWDAPIFYPTKTALAFSEVMFGNLWITLPVQYLTDNPAFAANSLLFASFVLSMYCVFLLVYDATNHYWAGFIAGLVFSYNPYRWSHGGHLQLLPIFWSALALLFANRFLNNNQKTPFFLMLICIWVQYYASVYLGTMLLTLVIILFLIHIFLERSGSDRWFFFTNFRLLALMVIGGIVSILVLLPLGVPYLEAADAWGFVRSLEDNSTYSAELLSFFCSPEWGFKSYSSLATIFQGVVRSGEGAVFLGITPWILMGYSFITNKRRRSLYVDSHLIIFRRYAWASLFMAIFMLGPFFIFLNQTTEIPMPYQLFYYLIPGAKAIRVPARFAQFLLICMTVMGSFSIVVFFDRLKNRSKLIRFCVICILASLLYWDYSITETKGIPAIVQSEFPSVYKHIADKNADKPILELPVGQPGPAWNAYQYLHYQTLHWRPTLGGMSGWYPPGRYYLSNQLDDAPSQTALQFLNLTPAKTVLIHLDLYSEKNRDLWAKADLKPFGFDFTGRFDNTLVWDRKADLPNISSKLNISKISYRFKENKCYINLFLQPAGKGKSWRYLEKGWSEVLISVIYNDGKVSTYKSELIVPPYILSGNFASVKLPKIKIPHVDDIDKIHLASPVLEDYNIDMKNAFRKYTWQTMDGKAVGIANSVTKQLAAITPDKNSLIHFRIIKISDTHISLMASNGYYVCAEGGGGRELTANREYIDIWEMFESRELEDGNIALISNTGHYVSSRNGILTADSKIIGRYETFHLDQLKSE